VIVDCRWPSLPGLFSWPWERRKKTKGRGEKQRNPHRAAGVGCVGGRGQGSFTQAVVYRGGPSWSFKVHGQHHCTAFQIARGILLLIVGAGHGGCAPGAPGVSGKTRRGKGNQGGARKKRWGDVAVTAAWRSRCFAGRVRYPTTNPGFRTRRGTSSARHQSPLMAAIVAGGAGELPHVKDAPGAQARAG